MTTSTLDITTKSGISFGKELREKEFLFGGGYLNLNHGKLGIAHEYLSVACLALEDPG